MVDRGFRFWYQYPLEPKQLRAIIAPRPEFTQGYSTVGRQNSLCSLKLRS